MKKKFKATLYNEYKELTTKTIYARNKAEAYTYFLENSLKDKKRIFQKDDKNWIGIKVCE